MLLFSIVLPWVVLPLLPWVMLPSGSCFWLQLLPPTDFLYLSNIHLNVYIHLVCGHLYICTQSEYNISCLSAHVKGSTNTQEVRGNQHHPQGGVRGARKATPTQRSENARRGDSVPSQKKGGRTTTEKEEEEGKHDHPSLPFDGLCAGAACLPPSFVVALRSALGWFCRFPPLLSGAA